VKKILSSEPITATADTSSELNAISRFKASEDLSEVVKRKILFDNPKKLYDL